MSGVNEPATYLDHARQVEAQRFPNDPVQAEQFAQTRHALAQRFIDQLIRMGDDQEGI
ncbi:MAG: hypothetical protein Q7R81_01705 [Candidatus Peregrinibacteria bacterium]|nr:hypothetical protein [Candidatus Peregrinibacteria bacterium]